MSTSNPPQWQHWNITLPAGRHHLADGTTIITTGEIHLDAYISNNYADEASMKLLVQRAGCEYEFEPVEQP